MYLLAFTAILLVVLWLVQICYLDVFYKIIKTHEAEKLRAQVTAALENDAQTDEEREEQIETLAAKSNMAVLVTDTEGNALYNAEYIANSRLGAMPAEQILLYYEQALSNGGTAKIEFKGGVNKTFPEDGSQPPLPEGIVPPGKEQDFFAPEGKKFIQNWGQDRIESVIYVSRAGGGEEEKILMVNTQLTPVDATVYTLRIELVFITVIMIGLSLLIALLISRQVSKSLIRINASAKEMAKGNFDVRFEGKDYREVAELSDTLNTTAVELNKNERLRRELIANVSHDLRTPLTMIIAYAEVMRDLPGENSPENVQVVIDEACRLTGLVNDMLDISKLQAGVMEKQAKVYNLTESIKTVFTRYNKLKEQDGYNISFAYDDTAEVEADEYKIDQVIYNLINNAVNYTGADKQVWVRQTVREDKVRIEVEDSGSGIAPEALPYVWDRYYKVDKTHKRAVMGTGLGLSIVKNILELHHAAYGVESTVGSGSVFWFELELYK